MLTKPLTLPAQLRSRFHRSNWVSYYTATIMIVAIGISLYLSAHIPDDWFGLLLFALAAALVELTSVELYINSRSRVSVSTIIVIAAIVIFGPAGGALAYLTSGVMTAVTTSFLQSETPESGQASIWQRLAFNTGMLIIAAALAGFTYTATGGVPAAVLRWGNLLPLVLAVLVDTLTNILLLMGVIHLQTGRSPKDIWNQEFVWGVPIALAGGIIGGGGLALGFATLGAGGLAIFMLPVMATGYAFRAYVNNTRVHVNRLEAMNKTLDSMNQRLEQSNLELLQTLGAVIDAFDVYTYGHSTQVALYGQAIAEEMGMSQATQEKILRGGLIHDVGKVGVKDSIIGKPGRLTDAEYEALKQHPVIGAEIVGQMTGIQELVPLVRNHHERWDGRGYPDGLQGAETTMEARILALADSLDAMLSDRPYQQTRTIEDVMKEVVRCSGSQFDPAVVDAFLRVYQKRGAAFFKNSATRVDKILARNGVIKPEADLRYLKKSMLNRLPTIQGTDGPQSTQE